MAPKPAHPSVSLCLLDEEKRKPEQKDRKRTVGEACDAISRGRRRKWTFIVT